MADETDETEAANGTGSTDETEAASDAEETVEAAVERFLDETASALDSYDQGYADADATLSVVRTHMDELAAAIGEGDDEN